MKISRAAHRAGACVLLASAGYAAAHLDADRMTPAIHLSHVGLLVGLLLMLWAALRVQGVAIDEAYKLGYDLGYEAGCRRAGEEERVVVDMASRRHGPTAAGES